MLTIYLWIGIVYAVWSLCFRVSRYSDAQLIEMVEDTEILPMWMANRYIIAASAGLIWPLCVMNKLVRHG